MSGAGLQGYIACGYGEETMRCYGTGLQGVIACDCDDYTALRLAAQGCRATVPVAMATTLHCCEWPRAAGLHCLRLWRLHHADVRGAGLQSYSAGGGGDYTALL